MHLYKDTDHTVKLCCADRGEPLGNLSKNTFEEIKNNDNFISIRKQFLNDERPDRCRDCWLAEDNGRHSLRTSMLSYTQENKLYNEQANYHVGYLDFRTSNLCNLGCKICIPHFSSKLAEVWGDAGLLKNNGSMYHKGDKKYYTSFHKNRVKFKDIGTIITDKLFKIYFAGGEPLLSDEHWYILDYLKKEKITDITIMYNTNFTLLNYKGKDLLEYIKDFREVHLSCSLDGIEESFDYWRTGGKWQTILENLDRVKNFRDNGHSNIILGVTSAVGWMNFREVFKLHKFLVDEGFLLKDGNSKKALQMQPVLNSGVSFEHTPPIIKDEILDLLDEYEKWRDLTFSKENRVLDNITILKNLVKNSKFSFAKFNRWLTHNKTLDKHFGTKLENQYTFQNPEFVRVMKILYKTGDTLTPESAFKYTKILVGEEYFRNKDASLLI